MTIYTPDFFVGRRETVVASAAVVVPVIEDIFSPLSVLDLGCGQGEWLEALGESCEDLMGVDIAYTDQLVVWPCASYSRHDLTEPLDLGRTFDLVLCLETGEHLPEEAADTLVDSAVSHSDTVVFGAAVPGQEGRGHINCQPHEYWHDKFNKRGYAMLDVIRPRIARDTRVSPWYRTNIFAYISRGR